MQGITVNRARLLLFHTKGTHLKLLPSVGSLCARSSGHKEMENVVVIRFGTTPLQKPFLEVTVTGRQAA